MTPINCKARKHPKFASIIGEGFANLLDDEMTLDEFNIKFKKIVHTAAEKEIGHKRQRNPLSIKQGKRLMCITKKR